MVLGNVEAQDGGVFEMGSKGEKLAALSAAARDAMVTTVTRDRGSLESKGVGGVAALGKGEMRVCGGSGGRLGSSRLVIWSAGVLPPREVGVGRALGRLDTGGDAIHRICVVEPHVQ